MSQIQMFGQCLSDSLTLRILALLRQGELCVCEIRAVLKEDRGRIDNRLKKLLQADLVRSRRRGAWTAFRIHTHYVDLIETVFEAYDEAVTWDPKVTQDAAALAEELRKRVEGWCPGTRSKRTRNESSEDLGWLRVEPGGSSGDGAGPAARRIGLRCRGCRRRGEAPIRRLVVV